MHLRSLGARGLCLVFTIGAMACGGDDNGSKGRGDSGNGDRDAEVGDAAPDAFGDAAIDVGDASDLDAGEPEEDSGVGPVDYIKGSQTAADSRLGRSLAISGDTIVVGAPGEAGGGGAYVFVRRSGMWLEQAHLHASNRDEGDLFGGSVAIDADTIVIGAIGESSAANTVNGDGSDNQNGDYGAAYVFVRDDGVWTEQAYLKASNSGAGDAFGYVVAIDGDTVAVGAQGEDSSASGINGNGTDDSAMYSGAAYVFVRDGEDWSQQAYLKASNPGMFDRFGITLAISGDTLAVGAYFEDSVAGGIDGDQNNEAAEDSGAVYLFERDIDTWSQVAYVKASNVGAGDRFGYSVGLDGDVLVVSAPEEAGSADDPVSNEWTDSGAAYVFERDDEGAWSERAYLKPEVSDIGDLFGTMVAVHAGVVAVGAKDEDGAGRYPNPDPLDNSAAGSGAAYVFEDLGDGYVQTRYVKASNAGAGDAFGAAVGLADALLVVGAFQEGGVNDASPNEGAFYVFGL